ncbi:MAG: hypothetical protein ABJB40_03545 [Acidobacteriota bacterium]
MPYYDHHGIELDPTTLTVPRLCTICEKMDDENEEILCNITRLDQREKREFKCRMFVSLYATLIDDIID